MGGVPQTLGALLALLVLVAPGLAFELRRELRRPALQDSAFREAMRTAFTSLLFSGSALAILALLSTVIPGLLPDFSAWLLLGTAYAAENIGAIALFLSLQFGLAVGIALLVENSLHRRTKGSRLEQGTALWHVLGVQRKQDTVWMGLTLQDGTQVWGYLNRYDVNKPLAEGDVVLQGPGLSRQLPTQTTAVNIKGDWERIVVPGERVLYARLRFNPKAEGDTSAATSSEAALSTCREDETGQGGRGQVGVA